MSLRSSPVITSQHPNHLIAWRVLGKEIASSEPASHYTLRMMASACMYSMVEATTHPYDLLTTYAQGSDIALPLPDGTTAGCQAVVLMPHGRNYNTDHTTAEIRQSLASGWHVAEDHIINTASGLHLERTDTLRITGRLLVPRPDDVALPNLSDYAPKDI